MDVINPVVKSTMKLTLVPFYKLLLGKNPYIMEEGESIC